MCQFKENFKVREEFRVGPIEQRQRRYLDFARELVKLSEGVANDINALRLVLIDKGFVNVFEMQEDESSGLYNDTPLREVMNTLRDQIERNGSSLKEIIKILDEEL